MTKWVSPCKIIELSENTLRLIYVSRPGDLATITKTSDVDWPESWRLLYNESADVAISFNAFDVTIERCNFFKHGLIIELEINHNLDEDTRQAWRDFLRDDA